MQKRMIHFFHYKDSKFRPQATVCHVYEPNGETGIGVALCSELDSFNGKRGKRIAVGRAFKALTKKENTGEIKRDEAWKIMDAANIRYLYKSVYLTS